MRSLYLGVSILAIVYTFFQHLGFLPIVVLMLSFTDSPGYLRRTFIALLVSSILLSVGVIVDAYVGIANLVAFQGVENMTRVGIQGIKRGDFTIGSTNAFVALSVGLASIYVLVTRFDFGILKAFPFLLFILFALYASGSRASFILGAFFITIILFRFLKTRRYFPVSSILIILLGGVFTMSSQFGGVQIDPDKLERFSNLSSEETEGNLGRFQSWADGVSMTDPTRIYAWSWSTNPKVGELFGSATLDEAGVFSRIRGRRHGLILF